MRHVPCEFQHQLRFDLVEAQRIGYGIRPTIECTHRVSHASARWISSSVELLRSK
jgi:hypothetical protein